MQHFQELIKTIGDVYEGSYTDIQYLKTPDAPATTFLDPDCAACTQLFDLQDKVIVRFHAGEIPKQVFEAGMDKQPVNRGASVTFIDGTKARLVFTGNIIRKP
jgi:hypothetical protein